MSRNRNEKSIFSIKSITTTLVAVLAAIVAALPSSLDFCVRGLALNIAGVLITFFYGMPQPAYELQGVLAVEDMNVDSNGVSFGEMRKMGGFLRKCHTISAYLGLCYLLFGFVFQAIYQMQQAFQIPPAVSCVY